MYKHIKWLAIFFAALVLTALFEPILMGLVEETGFHDDPISTVKPAVNWIARIIGDIAFFWVAGGAIGFALGVWLDSIMRRLGRGRVDKVISLGDDAISLAGRLDTLSSNYLASPKLYPCDKYDADIRVMRSRLKAHNVQLLKESDFRPLLSKNNKKAKSEVLSIISADLRTVGVYLRSGDIKLAQKHYGEKISDIPKLIHEKKHNDILQSNIDSYERSLRS